MAVTVKTESESEKINEAKDVKDKQDATAEELVDSMDLPFDEIGDEGGEVEPKTEPKKKEEKKEEEDEPEEEDDPEEEEEVDEGEEESEEEEEVVPKSKFKKRVDSLTAKNRILEAQLAEKKESPVDSRTAKLEAMSESELKAMKVQARDKWFDAKQDSDAGLAQQYQQLEDEIDGIIKSAPDKFIKAQTKAYDTAIQEVMGDPDNENIDFEKSGKDIKDIASGIYNKYPELQKLKSGQATALKMAVDHFRETQRFTKGKSRVKELKQKNNKLKRKTSLDSSAIKGNAKNTSTKAKYARAKSSNSFYDKLEYADDILNVDQYLPSEHR